MKLILFLGHPAQYHFYKNSLLALQKKGVKIKILIKTKDILEELLQEDGFKYVNIEPYARKKTAILQFLIILRRFIVNALQLLTFRPNLVMGSEPSLAQLCSVFRITYIAVGEDDYQVVKSLADVLMPPATFILSPNVCDYSKFQEKKISFEGYMKLAYLHPNYFTPNTSSLASYIDITSPYALIRLVSLSAHHDKNIQGISPEVLDKMINLFQQNGLNVYISSESTLFAAYKDMELKLPRNLMHTCLSQADILVCDSQSMAVEAAILGVPSIRVNGFVGRISVLEELEHTYKLTFGIKPENEGKIFEKLEEILGAKDRKSLYKSRKETMLHDKIDVTAFLIWLISNAPTSYTKVKGKVIDTQFMIENKISK